MKWNRNTALAVFLIGAGALMLIGRFNGLLGNILGWLIPAAMVFLGYYGIRQGRSTVGWIVLLLGLLFLLGKLWGLLAILVPIALIAFGWMLLTKRNGVFR